LEVLQWLENIQRGNYHDEFQHTIDRSGIPGSWAGGRRFGKSRRSQRG
jgi:hypothetical protein